MIVTDQVPTVPDVTTSAQSVSTSYCGGITHCQFCWICSFGSETISCFYEWAQHIHSLHLCRSTGHTGTLLLCFVVGVLITSDSIFRSTLVIILLANITWHASFCQSVLLSWNHQCCIKTQSSESNRRGYSWYHSSFQCLKQMFNNCFAIWSSYQMNLMLYIVCHKMEVFI